MSTDFSDQPRKAYAIASAKAYLEGLKSGHPFFTDQGMADHMTFSETWCKGTPIKGLIPEDIGMTMDSLQAVIKEWRIPHVKRYFEAFKAGTEGCDPSRFVRHMMPSCFGVSLKPEDIGTTVEEIEAAIKAWMIPKAKAYFLALEAGMENHNPYGLECLMGFPEGEWCGYHVQLTPEDIGVTEARMSEIVKGHVVQNALLYYEKLRRLTPNMSCDGLDVMMREKGVPLTPEDIGTTAEMIDSVKKAYMSTYGTYGEAT